MTANLTGGQAIIALIEAHGVDTVFGMPGVHTLELYRGLAGGAIRHIGVRHEQGAGFMADGYARATGRPGVCLLITGPGVTNAATPIGQAYSDSVPMLVISSDNAARDLGMGRGRLHEITDQRAVTAPLTAFSATALDAAEIPNLFARAFAHFAAARPRPVHISLPLDLLAATADIDLRPRPRPAPPIPAAEAIAAAAETLAGARRPVIVVGGGGVDDGAALLRLAEALGAAVVTTVAAKGVIAADHPLAFAGALQDAHTRAFVARADALIAVGTELGETDTWVERLELPARLVRIDIDIDVTQRDYRPEVALVGDAGAAMNALADALAGRAPATGFDPRTLAEEGRQPAPSGLAARHVKLLDALRAALPDDGMVASDMTQIAYAGNGYFPCHRPRSWFHPSGYGTLGYALPAAIGAKLGAPERAAVALVGDGGFLFTLQELGTAVEHGVALAIVLWNNDGLGEIEAGMVARDIAPIGVRPRNPDYLALARAFGARALRPDSLDGFGQALRDAFAADGPTLIEVREDAPWLD